MVFVGGKTHSCQECSFLSVNQPLESEVQLTYIRKILATSTALPLAATASTAGKASVAIVVAAAAKKVVIRSGAAAINVLRFLFLRHGHRASAPARARVDARFYLRV